MAEINLLKQNSSSGDFTGELPKFFLWALGVLLLAMIGYYGYLFIDSSSLDKQISQVHDNTNKSLQAAQNDPRRQELFTRQLQLKSLNSLIDSHVYWSQIFSKLALVTLKSASYGSMKIDSSGVSLDVTVPSWQDLDKYMQIFDLPDFNQYFYNIRITGLTTIQTKTSSALKFGVLMDYDPKIIQYNNSQDNGG